MQTTSGEPDQAARELHFLQWMEYTDNIKADGQIEALAEDGVIPAELSVQNSCPTMHFSIAPVRPQHDPNVVLDETALLPYPPYEIHALRWEYGLGYSNVGEYYYTVPPKADRLLDLYTFWHTLFDGESPLFFLTWLRLEQIPLDPRTLGRVPRVQLSESPASDPHSDVFRAARRAYESNLGRLKPKLMIRVWEDIAADIDGQYRAAHGQPPATTVDRCPAFEMDRRICQLTLSFVSTGIFLEEHRRKINSPLSDEKLTDYCQAELLKVVNWWNRAKITWDKDYGFTQASMTRAMQRYNPPVRAMKQVANEIHYRSRAYVRKRRPRKSQQLPETSPITPQTPLKVEEVFSNNDSPTSIDETTLIS